MRPTLPAIVAATLTALAFLLLPRAALAAPALAVDGRLDEPAWATAEPLPAFQEVQPLTLAAPRWPVKARTLAREEGLWVGVEVATPPDQRTRGRSSRDAAPLDADPVSLLIDFAGSGQGAYEFTVSLSGTLRDGQADATGQFSYDWDARWFAATHETPEGWTAEFLIPWSVAAAPSSGETRQLGLWVGTFVKSQGIRYAAPGVGLETPRWLRELYPLTVPRHVGSTLDLFPYVSLAADRVREATQGRAGLDVLWNSGTGHQVTATLRPDFGQVEADDVVVNFSAVEVFFSDRRPFFTEGSALFDVRLPGDTRLINTRRIGAFADGGQGEAAPVDGALKYVGELGRWDVGAFTALEGDTGEGATAGQGRTFGAGRLRYRFDSGAVGYLGTWVDRPGLGYAARVDTLDADFTLRPGLTFRGRALQSRRQDSTVAGDLGDGDGGSLALEWDGGKRWVQSLELLSLSRHLELDDFGFLPRNNLGSLSTNTEWHTRSYPDSSPIASSNWGLEAELQQDAAGRKLQHNVELNRFWAFRGGAEVFAYVFSALAGRDDILSRGNGDVMLPRLVEGGFYYGSPRFGPGKAWFIQVEGGTIQAGLGGTGFYAQFRPRVVVTEHLSLQGSLEYRQAPDWLLWTGGATLGTFRQKQLYMTLGANAFFGTRHELRARLQWLGLSAKGRESYAVTGGAPLRTAGAPADFTVTTLAFQVRYRYEIAPLSDLYVVYGRGGDQFEEGRDRSLGRLWQDAIAERDAEQLLVKLRYRF